MEDLEDIEGIELNEHNKLMFGEKVFRSQHRSVANLVIPPRVDVLSSFLEPPVLHPSMKVRVDLLPSRQTLM
ncbi:hypothetical protein MRX96_001420 [Rhipicephalus microplus]